MTMDALFTVPQEEKQSMADELMNLDLDTRVKFAKLTLDALVDVFGLAGIAVRIDRRPLQPLAMGHDEPVVEVWLAREQPA